MALQPLDTILSLSQLISLFAVSETLPSLSQLIDSHKSQSLPSLPRISLEKLDLGLVDYQPDHQPTQWGSVRLGSSPLSSVSSVEIPTTKGQTTRE
jgi:hypothetical protein